MNAFTFITNSAATGIAGATIGTPVGAFLGMAWGLAGGDACIACTGIVLGSAGGAAIGGVGGLMAPSIILLITTTAQAIFWSFSYLTASIIDKARVSILTVNENPLISLISVLAVLILMRFVTSKRH